MPGLEDVLADARQRNPVPAAEPDLAAALERLETRVLARLDALQAEVAALREGAKPGGSGSASGPVLDA